MSEQDLENFWWEQKPDGTYLVDWSKLLFSITLDELCIVDLLHNCDKDGKIIPREELIARWKAQILNARRCDKRMLVRAAYYQFYQPSMIHGTWREGWGAAWGHINYLFSVDLDTAWNHLPSSEYTQKSEMSS